MSTVAGLIWPISGGVDVLDQLGGPYTIPKAAFGDGSVVVGLADNPTPNAVASKWAGTSRTTLASVTGTDPVADACSNDGTTIVGDNSLGGILWTSGGSAGAALAAVAGCTGSLAVTGVQRTVSDNGQVVVGSCSGGTLAVTPTIWTNGVPSQPAITLTAPFVTLVQADCVGCSEDGTTLVIANYSALTAFSAPGVGGCYWLSGVNHVLDSGFFSTNGVTCVCCNGAGSVIYGQTYNGTVLNAPGYWDALAGGGTPHYIAIPAGYSAWRIAYCAETGGICCGSGQDGGFVLRALKATGTVTTVLPDLGFGGAAAACSGDGSIVVGFVNDTMGNSIPAYWDAGNVLHQLPLPTAEYSAGEVAGISRDGSLLFGTATFTSTSPTGLGCGSVAAPSAIAPLWNATSPPGDTYTVQYRLRGAVSWTQITGITDTTVTITGLNIGAAYEWQVAAVISGITGSFSDTAVCSTPGLSQPIPQSLNRWRGGVGINWHGLALVGDAFSNVIGLSDFNTFTEYGNTMQFLVTTPPLHDDRKRIFVSIFEIEVEAGQGLPTPPYGPPQMMLDVSKDGGVTWQQLQSFRSMGSVGQYFKRLRWINLGQSRTWVFRLRCTDPVRRYIIGTYIDQYKGLG